MNYLTKYFKIAVLPWVTLYVTFLVTLFMTAVQGHFGQYGGLPSAFRILGLHSQGASNFVLSITGLGALLASVWFVVDACHAVWRKYAAPAWEKWVTRYPLLYYTPMAIAVLLLLIFLSFALAPAKHLPPPPTAPNAHDLVLFQLPPPPINSERIGIPPIRVAMRTIHGEAIVTKTGPNTYRIKMLHCRGVGGSAANIPRVNPVR